MNARLAVFGLILTSACSSFPVFGETSTWLGASGSGGDGFWTRVANWSTTNEPTLSTDVLFDNVTDGTGGTVRLNGGAAGLPFRSVRGITFLPGVGSYVIASGTGGDKKELLIGAGGIVNLSTNLQDFSTQIFLTNSQTWDAHNGGILAEDVVSIGGNDLTVTGDYDVAITGVITGTGDLIKDGAGMLNLGGSNTYTGDTYLNSGTLTFSTNQNLSGYMILGGGVLDANDQSLSFGDRLLLTGDATIRLGDNGTSQTISFLDALAIAGTLTLTIEGWSASPGSDQVGVVNQPSQTFLTQVLFEGFPKGAIWSSGILVPIPEPSASLLVVLGLVGFVVVQSYRRRTPIARDSTEHHRKTVE